MRHWFDKPSAEIIDDLKLSGKSKRKTNIIIDSVKKFRMPNNLIWEATK